MNPCRFDFHIHSCLSPCGSDDMTPSNIAAMCALAGYQAVALTDHNTADNCPAFCKACERSGLIGIPGMELTTAEEVHVVCLFPELASALDFGALVRHHLPPIQNRPEFFGHQLVVDADEHILREETALLSGATDLSLWEVRDLVRSMGGIAYPAHIDRPSFSLMSNLGFWSAEAGFTVAELSLNCPPDYTARPDLAGVRFVRGCDAHYLHQIPDPTQSLSPAELTPRSLLDCIFF